MRLRLVIIFLSLLFFPLSVFAQTPNNKVGIHLAQPHLEDLDSVAKMVNSNGGDWGYVTLVMQENDRKTDKWQEIFNRMRKLHLIPIVRLATQPEGEVWRRPKKEEASDWVSFLQSLNWVVKNRYVILFNEPNHGSEWGGEVDAKNYGEVAVEFAKKLKEADQDYFVMLAGMDASAPSSPPVYEDEAIFLGELFSNITIEQYNNLFSGFVSHSYPNPNFAGSPYDFGRGSIRTYQWELELLQRLGVTKELPVFVTETGWKRQVKSEKLKVKSLLDENTVADYFNIAYKNVWLPDNRVWAVTPFVFDYQGPPFLEFSWKLPSAMVKDGQQFYPQYYTVQNLTKVKGEPEQREKGVIIFDYPTALVAQSSYQLSVELRNLGQGYWDKQAGYRLRLKDGNADSFEYLFSDISNLDPFQSQKISLFFKTGDQIGKKKLTIQLVKNQEQVITKKQWQFTVEPLPSLELQVNLFPKLNDQGREFEVQLFDRQETLVFKKNRIEIFGGYGKVENLQNVIIGNRYRVVILNPYYLPRQTFITIIKQGNRAKFRPMLPIDFNLDGKFTIIDVISLIKNPGLIRLFLP